MLKTIKSGAARFTWRGRVLLLCVAAGALALPAVQLMRPSPAAAQDKAAADTSPDKKPDLDPFGQPPKEGATAEKGEVKRRAAERKAADDPFAAQPRATATESKLPTGVKQPAETKPAPDGTKAGAVPVEYLPQPSANEKKILAALSETTECDFTDTPLVEVIEYFQARHNDNVRIRLDNKTLTEAAVDSSVPVSAQYRDVSLRSTLRHILADLGMAFVIRDEMLVITTEDKAQQWLIVRTYPVGDLVGGEAKTADFDGLLQAITTTVDPKTWHEEGGPGTAKVVPKAKSIVVSQTDATHDKVLDLLRSLRAAKAKQESQDATTLDIRPDIQLKIER